MTSRTMHQNDNVEIHIVESNDGEGIIIDILNTEGKLWKTLPIWYDSLEA